ncbi:MAG: DUF29 domain-containing protein [Cyanobacteria bacterium]|nr:DUF29 domain-containing protein [Cyanobacteriota bacterium]
MNDSLYATDFYTWVHQQSELLYQKRFDQLDLSNLIEELTDLGNRHYDQLESQLIQLVAHLLKWKVQHWRRSNSWRATIRVQRTSIDKLLRRNPGLKSRLNEALLESWSEARDLAIAETDFPDLCPFKLEEIMNPDFWPES